MRGLILSLLFLISCTSVPDKELYKESSVNLIFEYKTFEEYVSKVEKELRKYRIFISKDQHEKEIEMNLPFEIKPLKTDKNFNTQSQKYKRGILLIHGLSDSPWSFIDIGKSFADQGYLVRTLLLPGHGTRPADMIHADVKDWEESVRKQTELLKDVVDEPYLGGFSTGGNLAYLQAEADRDIKGLFLASPAFLPASKWAFLLPYVASLKPWLFSLEDLEEASYAKYGVIATNGYRQYYYTHQNVLQNIAVKKFNRPVYVVLTEHDSILDPIEISNLFIERFDNPKNILMWFGDRKPRHPRLIFVESENPDFRITNMSHMGILFRKDNKYYGVNGEKRICDNGAGIENALNLCAEKENIWYGAYGTKHKERLHARTTFNPEFDLMMEQIKNVFGEIK